MDSGRVRIPGSNSTPMIQNLDPDANIKTNFEAVRMGTLAFQLWNAITAAVNAARVTAWPPAMAPNSQVQCLYFAFSSWDSKKVVHSASSIASCIATAHSDPGSEVESAKPFDV